jgi:hypothetical protein
MNAGVKNTLQWIIKILEVVYCSPNGRALNLYDKIEIATS